MGRKVNRQGILTVISGFSGAGKGTIVKKLLEKYDYRISISATTRAPRDGEEHGREYFFLTREEFEGMIEKEQLIEWAQYVGNYYGTPREYVEEQLRQGKNVILEIEIQGALHVKKLFPDALMLFVTPPSGLELRTRLVGRGTETMDTVQKRLSRSVEEADYIADYDYIVINDNLEECVEQTHRLIQTQKWRTMQNKEFIQNIKEELSVFKEGDF